MAAQDPGEVVAWLVQGAPGAETPAAILGDLCVRLDRAGVAIDRGAVYVRTLHPTVMGRRFLWQRGGDVLTSEASYDIVQTPTFQSSPVVQVMRTGRPLHHRLDPADRAPPYEVMAELAGEGYRDYLVEPLAFTTGEQHAASWCTRAAAGFSDRDLAALLAISAPLARLAEIYAWRRVAANLLNAYVGPDAGERILQGAVRRGDVESIGAVILVADLRDFTTLSTRRPAAEVTGLLNLFFDAAIPPIEAAGGDVLKFMGDGFLAIFRCAGAEAEERKACRTALACARQIRAAVAALNSGRDQPLRFGLSLHLGPVEYGNIGSATRLDFTTIGPAVNFATRLQAVAGRESRDVVVSEQVAALVDDDLEALGNFDLKGFKGPQRVFALTQPKP